MPKTTITIAIENKLPWVATLTETEGSEGYNFEIHLSRPAVGGSIDEFEDDASMLLEVGEIIGRYISENRD